MLITHSSHRLLRVSGTTAYSSSLCCAIAATAATSPPSQRLCFFSGDTSAEKRQQQSSYPPLPEVPGVSAGSLALVGASLPLVAKAGTGFTGHFYGRLFEAHPELLNTFNVTNQKTGKQRAALFGAIARSATGLLTNGQLPLDMLEGVCQKHCALNVLPTHYDVVGEHIVGTIVDLLDPGESILNAWIELYGSLAGYMIRREEEIYREVESRPGGWRGTRQFTVAKKRSQSSSITEFEFVPNDRKPICNFQSGQYVTVWVKPPQEQSEYRQPRHYSIINSPSSSLIDDVANNNTPNSYKIAVRKQPDGLVSTYLHDWVEEGDVIDLSPPMGDFTIANAHHLWTAAENAPPVVLLSAGVGMTPMLSMLHTLEDNAYFDECGDRCEGDDHAQKLLWLHGAKNGQEHAFKDYLVSMGKEHPDHVTRRVWYSEPNDDDAIVMGDKNTAPYHFSGQMDLEQVKHYLPLDHDSALYYFCGPLPFMESIQKQLLEFGVPEDRLHCESFGPADQSLMKN